MATDYLVNLKDANVAQMVYEQDVDLGFEWQHLNQPIKQLKDINKPQTEKSTMGGSDFCIDGETGEQVPVAAKKRGFPLSSVRPNRLACSQHFNFEGTFNHHQGQVNSHHTLKPVNQSNSVWQQSNEYPEPPSMGSSVGKNFHPNGTQSSSLTNLNQNFSPRQIPSASGSADDFYLNHVNSCNNYNNFQSNGSALGHSALYNGESPHPYTPPSSQISPDTYSPHVNTSPNMVTQLIHLDESSSIERNSCSTVMSPENSEARSPFDRFNNYNYEEGALGNQNITSLPEPGQSFFELGRRPEVPYYLTNLVSENNSASSFSQNMNGAFLDPPISNYPPPPLHPSPPYSGLFLGKSTDSHMSINKSSISDLSEADSGVSMDRSPKSFSYLNSISSDEYISNSRDLSASCLHDAKAFPFNNLSCNLDASRKLSKKKSNQSTHSRESRDEKRAMELNLPFSLNEIILTPVEDYNEMLARTHLNAAQQALIKDIRRRGKNKVAAQNCRKRKIETISNMEEDVEVLRDRKQHLVDEQKQMEIRQHNMRIQYNTLHQQVFNTLRDETGRPYDPSQFRLDQSNGSVVMMPHGHPGPSQHMMERLGYPMDFKVKIEHQI